MKLYLYSTDSELDDVLEWPEGSYPDHFTCWDKNRPHPSTLLYYYPVGDLASGIYVRG
jgi:hypothetical protein